MKKILKKIDSYFQISKKHSTFIKEIGAGVMVFLAMIYIMPVNANILGGAGFPAGSVFIATALVSGIVTIFMGLFGKYPIALSVGMGMNAFLAFTVCNNLGYSWEEGLALVIVAGIIFMVISFTGWRQKIINAFPQDLKYAITIGLGFFIAFVGLKMGGIIAANDGTLVALGKLNNPVVLLSLFGVFLCFGLFAVSGKLQYFAIILAMAVTALLGLVLNLIGVDNMPGFNITDYGNIGAIFGKGIAVIPGVLLRPESYAVIFAMIFVNLFDTSATIMAVGKEVGMLNDRGQLAAGNRVIYVDAVGAVLGGIFGSSTVTSYAESTIGVKLGARTGLTAVTTGFLFLLAVFLYPLFSLFSAIPVGDDFYTPVTSLALVAVGAMLFANLKYLNWDDLIVTFTAFSIIIFMVLTYSLADGLGIGIFIYVIMKFFSGRKSEVSIILYIIAFFFLVNYILGAVLY